MIEKLSRRVALTRGGLDHRLRAVPVLILFPHSRCDCQCVMCDIWRAGTAKRELSESEIERHRRSLHGLSVRHAVLSGGEPLMHSNLFRFCRPLLEEGFQITLVTSGLLLERYAGQVADTCTRVVVSLDGPEKIHDRIRGRQGAFEALARGVSALRRARSLMPVTGRCTVQQLNYEYLSATVDAARHLDLSHISFLPADTVSMAFNRPQGWPEERARMIAVSRDGLPGLRESVTELLKRHHALIHSHFICEDSAKLWRLYDYFAAMHGLGQFPPQRCHAPWMSAVVDSEGNVLPCFFHAAYGNLREQSLPEVLNSSTAVAFRRQLEVATNSICQRCVCPIRHGGVLDRLSGGRLF